ncbi:hypothetical protein ATANTOWER_008235 [Ataeniobius toweri]|uniref:Uncharacterized protein n=1 Tax=Ataeniobius toweri TaxID=208326 RepID=A0ABU7BRL3_9TELE|nr:hypothetical protein [Ataeniobius toweri]
MLYKKKALRYFSPGCFTFGISQDSSSGLRYGDGPAADADPALHWWHQRSVAQPSGGDRPSPCWTLLDVLKQMN